MSGNTLDLVIDRERIKGAAKHCVNVTPGCETVRTLHVKQRLCIRKPQFGSQFA